MECQGEIHGATCQHSRGIKFVKYFVTFNQVQVIQKHSYHMGVYSQDGYFSHLQYF